MTSFNSTIDGMGGDEVNQSTNIQTEIVVATSGLFSYISGATIIGASVPTDNMSLTGSLVANSIVSDIGSFSGNVELLNLNIAGSVSVNEITAFSSISTLNLTATGNVDITGSIVALAGSFVEDVFASQFSDSDGKITSIGAGRGHEFYWGAKIQCGISTTSAGSDDWIVYQNSYDNSVDNVQLTSMTSGHIWIDGENVDVGSAHVYSEFPEVPYLWLAVGD